ncbi:hypothetical protein K0M31_005368 [Melipona bicolor]|uniref:Uncharacterized protein n=1 Tax=Melipona bicolor TaxID=60889 RepID=A0AA40FUX6_9HYME|nr:hypothetical protein K0M31_005368 [Melipona bicolor]
MESLSIEQLHQTASRLPRESPPLCTMHEQLAETRPTRTIPATASARTDSILPGLRIRKGRWNCVPQFSLILRFSSSVSNGGIESAELHAEDDAMPGAKTNRVRGEPGPCRPVVQKTMEHGLEQRYAPNNRVSSLVSGAEERGISTIPDLDPWICLMWPSHANLS